MTSIDGAIAGRVLTRRDRTVDVAVAATLLLATVATVPLSAGALHAPIPHPALVIAWAAAVTVPLAFRRIVPTVAAVVVVLAFIAGQAFAIPEYLVSQIAPFLALYTLGAWSPHRRRALIARIVLTVLLAFWFLLAVALSRNDPTATPSSVALSALSTALYLSAAIAFGEAGWRSALRRSALERRTAELQAERELTARQAVALERTRIARELHDVLAHHVSVMGVQAGAARRVLTTQPSNTAPALDALSRIEESSRRAVEELGRTVIALRDPDSAGVHPTMAPSTVGVAQIEDLISDTREAGVAVEYSVDGSTAVIPPSTALALHRIAQESLTNVRKHAGPGARVSVDLRVGTQTVELTVTDTGGTAATSDARSGAGAGTGTGQLGMSERAIAAGGTVEFEKLDNGYRVRAILPVHA